jgi:hypothetical protein
LIGLELVQVLVHVFVETHGLLREEHPAFKAQLAAQGTELPAYVEREFEAYLACGRLEHGSRAVRA